MSDNDFVERLRIRWETMGDMANDERAAAATEIESLRHGQREMMRTIATIRFERDEARRMICIMGAQGKAAVMKARGQHIDGLKMIEEANLNADELGWDCFKENT